MLRELLDECVDLGGTPGAANVGDKTSHAGRGQAEAGRCCHPGGANAACSW